jgi:hypothetical protein
VKYYLAELRNNKIFKKLGKLPITLVGGTKRKKGK